MMKTIERTMWLGAVGGLGYLTIRQLIQIEKRMSGLEHRLYEADVAMRERDTQVRLAMADIAEKLDESVVGLEMVERSAAYLVADSTGAAKSHVGATPAGVSVYTSDAQTVYQRVREQTERRVAREVS